MKLFRDRYRQDSFRRRGKTYTENGSYFITICAQYGEPWFGNIQNGKMKLSDVGEVIRECWIQLEKLRYYITLDEWVIMPNHVHGIIHIKRNQCIDQLKDEHLHKYHKCLHGIVEICQWQISTDTIEGIANIHIKKPFYRHKKPHSVGDIVGQFKSNATKRIRKMGHTDFAWQRDYFDRIIEDTNQLNTTRWYIRHNTNRWEKDRNIKYTIAT